MPVPCDYFCGAGYWSTPLPRHIAPRVGSRDNLTFPAVICLYFTPKIPNYHLCRDAKGKIHASEFEDFWEVNKLELKEECECMFMFAFLFNWFICLSAYASLPFWGDLGKEIEKRGGRWEGGTRTTSSRPPAFSRPSHHYPQCSCWRRELEKEFPQDNEVSVLSIFFFF